jgi:hypothetical protein
MLTFFNTEGKEMIAQFNRINQLFGANRVLLIDVSKETLTFQIDGWGRFLIGIDGFIHEFRNIGDGGIAMYLFTSNRSRWLEHISRGGIRDESGNMVLV